MDASLWGTAVYPGLEVLSIFGAVSPPTCGFARIGPCEEYPCWLLFDDDSSRFQWFLDGIAVPLVLIGIFFRCCMPCCTSTRLSTCTVRSVGRLPVTDLLFWFAFGWLLVGFPLQSMPS